MTSMQVAWVIYVAGSVGCCIAAGWLFKKAVAFLRYSAVVTTMVLLFTPYAIDSQTMLMAPAIFTLVFDGFQLGLEAIKPLLKLMAGIWLIGIILVLVYVFFTRHLVKPQEAATQNQGDATDGDDAQAHGELKNYRVKKIGRPNTKPSIDGDLPQEEQVARRELRTEEIPMRAIRD
jgi:hypothetical protein